MSSVYAYAQPVETAVEIPAESKWRPRVLLGGQSEQSEAQPSAATVRSKFDVLADDLAGAALGVSAPRRLMRHPSYLGILALGDAVVPLLLERLRHPGGRPVWLTLLGSLTSFQPGAGKETIEEAAAHWITWGKRAGYVG